MLEIVWSGQPPTWLRFYSPILKHRGVRCWSKIVKGHLIPSSNQVKLLGVKIDDSLKFEAHVNELCRKVNLRVHAFARLRPFLGERKSKLIFNSVIMSNFHTVFQIGYFLPKEQMMKLIGPINVH